MAEFPLLIFPQPALAERARRFGGGGKFKKPSADDQAKRLSPQFQRLQEAMNRRSASLQNDPSGIQPEQVLVLETVGSIDDFAKAVQKVNGLEWMGEFEIDELTPEFGFVDDKHPDKALKGHLFLVMSDQQALQQFKNLFESWKRTPNFSFPRGLAPLKHAFAQLHNIRPWGAEDRLRETGLMEDWQERLAHGQQVLPFEVELWYRNNAQKRRADSAFLRRIIETLGGEVLQEATVADIAYHGLLARLPESQVALIIDQREVRLLQCDQIMHLRPVGQCAVPLASTDNASELPEKEPPSLPEGNPVVAMLDGLPLTGHMQLDGRLIVDDPDDFESAYQAGARDHGTGMASLICHGDLNEGGPPTTRPVYVRPIMKPHPTFDGNSRECIPEDVLPIDIVHRAVRRMFEPEGQEPPAAPTVQVINLSIGDPARHFTRGMSAWARLIDWLSWKYNVLFVVSAGNHPNEIELAVPRTDLRNLSPPQRQKAVIEALATDTRHRRLLSPAETLNGLTVGALHTDASSPGPNATLLDPYARQGLLSTVSAHGPGHRRAIKPDLLLPGGRQLLAEKLGTSHTNATLRISSFSAPPGLRVAAPGRRGALNESVHTRGTSNATALGSRWAGFIYDMLETMRATPAAQLPHEFDVVLLKALLVHGADWRDLSALYEATLKNSTNSRTFKGYLGRFLGYGPADCARVLACTEQRVTILGYGELEDEQAHEFAFPLPPSLAAVPERRKLTITLAWLSPVNSARETYRVAQLWFDPKNSLASERLNYDHHAVQRGTVQHEVLVGDDAVPFQDGEAIIIRVNCRKEAGEIVEPIRYGLAVTLEVAEGIGIPIYQEVRTRLRMRVPVPGAGTGS